MCLLGGVHRTGTCCCIGFVWGRGGWVTRVLHGRHACAIVLQRRTYRLQHCRRAHAQHWRKHQCRVHSVPCVCRITRLLTVTFGFCDSFYNIMTTQRLTTGVRLTKGAKGELLLHLVAYRWKARAFISCFGRYLLVHSRSISRLGQKRLIDCFLVIMSSFLAAVDVS